MGSWVKTAYDSLLLLSLNVYGGMGKWLLCEMILWNNENVPAGARLNRDMVDAWACSRFHALPPCLVLLGHFLLQPTVYSDKLTREALWRGTSFQCELQYLLIRHSLKWAVSRLARFVGILLHFVVTFTEIACGE
jgi:hypothetical protein